MIQRLHIRNYAIIEELQLDFAEGLSIITGETGAGKSIVLGALSLILGGRADGKTLFDTDKKCIIEGRFNVSAYYLQAFFEEQDLDYDDELIIRREITPSGKSRAFVNDTPTNLKVLQRLGSTLIDLHQQFDTLYINNAAFQLELRRPRPVVNRNSLNFKLTSSKKPDSLPESRKNSKENGTVLVMPTRSSNLPTEYFTTSPKTTTPLPIS